jgi:hypothetical protein
MIRLCALALSGTQRSHTPNSSPHPLSCYIINHRPSASSVPPPRPTLAHAPVTCHVTNINPSRSFRFQAIFQAALQAYQKQTRKDLLVSLLASQLQSWNSTTAILAVLLSFKIKFGKLKNHKVAMRD